MLVSRGAVHVPSLDRYQLIGNEIDMPMRSFLRAPMPFNASFDATRAECATDVDVVAGLQSDRTQAPDLDGRSLPELEDERVRAGIGLHAFPTASLYQSMT